MPDRDPRVDAYIARAPSFAQPILERVREAVHVGCPPAQETMKWGMPHFEHKGPICGMAAFKQHVRFGFWKAALINARDPGASAPNMGAGRLTSVAELPARAALVRMVRVAAGLNDEGVKVQHRRGAPKPLPPVPPALAKALREHPKAAAAFKKFPPSHKREYIEWIADAKAEATRTRRVASAIEWIASGKSRNWKYEK
jgi:hypothetical protein